MKKILAAILITCALAGALSVSVFANFGAGTEVMANGTELIKTGLFGKKLTFSDTDFKQGLAITDFDSITVTKLPSSNEGTLMLAGRRVGEGTKIRRKNLGALVFIPTSKDVEEASFRFTLEPYADGNEMTFTLRFTDKINYEPKIDDSSLASIMTQRDITIHGKMSAEDGEGDKIEYIVVSYPENGSLEIIDKNTGEFRYTPSYRFIGDDAFSFVARDEWGNYSTLATMNVTVSERLSEVEYEDMKNAKEYNAAVALTAAGVMEGKTIGDGKYFLPEECVSRAEFVTMAMKVMGIRADSTLTSSYFDDNGNIPTPLTSYVATAQKAGYVSGYFENGKLNFKPNDNITLYEAASIIRKLIGEKGDIDVPVFENENDVPIYAKEDCYVLCSLGIIESDFNELTASDEVTRRECASILYKLMNM